MVGLIRGAERVDVRVMVMRDLREGMTMSEVSARLSALIRR